MSGIEIAGFILAVPGILQFFFQTAEVTAGKMKSDKKMKAYARDLHKFILEDNKVQLSRDFELAQGVLKDQATRADDKKRINRLFDTALGHLHKMCDLADVVLNTNMLEFRKQNTALGDMKDTISDITTSMSEFRHLVMSLHTIAVSEPQLLLDDQDFVLIGTEQDYDALNATTFLSRGRVSRSLAPTMPADGRFVLECKPYTTHSKKSVKKAFRILAQKLAARDQRIGILPLLGFRNNAPRNEFQLVFTMPLGVDSLQTLEGLYRSAKPRPSLNTRMNLCCQLAEAVLQTHMLGLVHKNIRPENVLLLPGRQDNVVDDAPCPAAFLAGWQYARNVDGGITSLAGEISWQRAIYQHPERQSEHAEEEYCMGHDIYSLGVCIMEILTWDPLVITTAGDDQETSLCQSYTVMFYQHEQDQETQDDDVTNPEAFQRTLLRMAQKLLPAAAGSRMADLVSQCLTCLDGEANRERFKVSREQDHKAVAVCFVDTVLKDIRRVMNAI